MTKKNETYYVSYRCKNCLFACKMTFTKGEEAPDSLPCPNCDCKKLVKVKK